MARDLGGSLRAIRTSLTKGPHIGVRQCTRWIGAVLTYGPSATHIGASGEA